jgi:hypothetical protein
MGYIAHNMIACTAWKQEHIEIAHKKARSLFSESPVTEIYATKTNGYFSFFICPDGSKEGWETSQNGDEERKEFIEWLSSQDDLYVDAVDLRYGGDNPELAQVEGKTK